MKGERVSRRIFGLVMIYPPGIPILIPGGMNTQENLVYTRKNAEERLTIQGNEDDQLRTLRVIKECSYY